MNRFFLFWGLLLVILLSGVNLVFGQTPVARLWTGGAGTTNWNTAGNWSPSGIPSNIDQVTINTNVTFTNTTSISPTVGSLFINAATVQLGVNITGITVSGVSISTPSYTFKMLSGASFNPQNSTLTINGAAPVIVASSSFGSNAVVTINSSRTAGDDGSDQTVQISSSTINGSFTCSANCFKFTSVVFNGSATITKNSSTPEVNSINNAGNTFNSTATLTNNSTNGGSNLGNLSWGNGDSFNSGTAQVSLSNTASANFYVTSISGTAVTFKGPVTFTNANTSSGKIILADGVTNTVNFSGISALKNIYFYNNSTSISPKGEIQIGNAGAVNFDFSTVLLGCTGGGYIYVGYTSGGSNKITVTGNSKFDVAPSGVSVPYFTSGELHIDRLQLNFSLNSYTCSLSLAAASTTAVNIKSGCLIYRPITVTTRRTIGIGGLYNYPAVFNNQSGAAAQITDTYDQLTFNNDVSFINMATVAWSIGGTTGSTTSNNNVYFNSPNSPTRSALVVQCNSTGDILFGYNPSTFNITNNAFKARRDISTAGSVYLGFKANINVISSVLSNSATRTDLTLEESGVVSGGGPSISLGSNIPGAGYGTFTFNGVLNTTNFLGGIVIFGRYTATSDVNVTAGASPDATTLISVSQYAAFNKNTYLKAPNITATGGVFGAAPVAAPPYIPSSYTWTSTIWRTSGAAASNPNYFTGLPVFNGPVTIYNESSQPFIWGNTLSDIFTFNSNVTLYRSGSGDIRTSALGISYYKGNYTYYGNPDPAAMLGQSIFNGLVDQNIFCVSLSQVLRFNILEVVKPAPIVPALLNDVVLGCAIAIGGTSSQLKLTTGNIRTTSSSLLTLEDGGIIIGGSAASYVDGPLNKTGSIPAVTPYEFKFHIGKSVISGSTVNKIYMPVSITMPLQSTSAYTAEFFNQNQPLTNALGSIADVQRCQYWTISHTGPNENIAVTLPWNNASGQSCYTVNPNVVCVAQQQLGLWQNVGSNVTTSGNQGVVKSNILTNQLSGSYTYFCLGYLNALVIDSKATNFSPYTISGGCEALPGTYYSSLDGTFSGDKTILSNSVNTVGGYLVVHPNFSSSIDISIGAALGGNNEPLTIRFTTNATANPVVNTVKTDEGDGAGFNDMSPNFYSKSTNQLVFYKQKPDDVLNQLTHNLPDGVTFEVKTSSTGSPTVPLQISGIPSGVTSATLSIYYNSGLTSTTLVTQNNSTLIWNGFGTIGTYNGLVCPEGLYTYDLTIVASSQSYVYKGQLILKYK